MQVRIRDQAKHFRPQQKIIYNEWVNINTRAVQAEKFLSEKNPLFQIMAEDLELAENQILSGVRETREENVISELIKRVKITPRQVNNDELVGQIKYISGYLKTLKMWVANRDDLIKKEADGVILIEREQPNDE
jgi:hypothetical protein